MKLKDIGEFEITIAITALVWFGLFIVIIFS